MDWSNERYVRVYTRDTDDWLALTWQGRALLPLIFRKVDRAGMLQTKRGARGVAAMVGLPIEVVEVGLSDLLQDGCVVEVAGGYLCPNFIEAQEAPQSDAQRARESRERRRDRAKHSVTERDEPATNRDGRSQNVTETSHAVTPRHTLSHAVTPANPTRTNQPESINNNRARANEPTDELLAAVLAAEPVQRFLHGLKEHRREGYVRRFGAWLNGMNLPAGVRITPVILVAAIDEYDGGDSPDLLLRFACRKARTMREHAVEEPKQNGGPYYATPDEINARFGEPAA